MHYEQTAIPMPLVGVQVTLRRDPGRGWVVDRRVLRQDQGWQPAGRWTATDQGSAELCAREALEEAWSIPPLD